MTLSDTAAAPADGDALRADWTTWHDEHEIRRADPHGFLAVTGLHWLTEEPARFPGAPGAWSTGPDGPVVELDHDEEIDVDGTPVRGRFAFGVLPERGGRTAGWGDAVLEVARLGGYARLRPRPPEHPLRTQYTGTPTFPPHPRWEVPGRYVPFAEPRPT